jgi:2-keto-4-pentenoate hydratase/2-oxohepta-3-ene-1,7-dioic acid hydratase in catechol pathway
MKLVRFQREGAPAWGMVLNDGVCDLTDVIGREHGAIHPHLEDGCRRLETLAAARGATLPLEGLRYAPFLPDPAKIFCVGVNYPDRNAEYKDGAEQPPWPSLFMRAPRSFTGHDQPLLRPRESDQLDYEGEIALVIGRTGRRIAEADAHDHIAGLVLMNEGTIRDWTRHAKFNVTQGKNVDSSGALGPWMVTPQESGPFDQLTLETRVNGEVRQSDSTARLMFSFAGLVAYVSRFATLETGDIISTGTPTGAGARFDPPRWLRPGDVVEVSCPGIGVLRNTVADDRQD